MSEDIQTGGDEKHQQVIETNGSVSDQQEKKRSWSDIFTIICAGFALMDIKTTL
jgi:hypothetical protein